MKDIGTGAEDASSDYGVYRPTPGSLNENLCTQRTKPLQTTF